MGGQSGAGVDVTIGSITRLLVKRAEQRASTQRTGSRRIDSRDKGPNCYNAPSRTFRDQPSQTLNTVRTKEVSSNEDEVQAEVVARDARARSLGIQRLLAALGR